MLTTFIHYGLLIGFAIALLYAAFTDIRSRTIGNHLNLAIAAAAPVFWWASGMALWPDVAWQLGFALTVAAILIGVYALGLKLNVLILGGGDIKLLGAIALWLSPVMFLNLLIIMSIAGGVLTLLMMISKRIQKTEGAIKVPYGVAIAFSGLWTIWGIAGQSSQTIF